MKKLLFLLVMFSIIFWTVFSQVPNKISYQGLLKTTSCTYVTDGNYDIEFKFYDLISGGILKHTETLNSVPVAKGLFNVILGPLPMIFNEPLFVEITLLAGPDILSPVTFSPRTELTSVAYSFTAIHALTANPVGPAGGDLTGTYPDPTIKPDAVTTGKILDGTIEGADIANGQVVRSLNNITDHIKLVGKNGAAITSNLDTIFIHSAGAGGGGGISAIQNTDGRLDITDPTGPTATINISKNGASAGQALMYDGSNVVWQTPSGGGGFTLPYEGSASTIVPVFSITNNGTGIAIRGIAQNAGLYASALSTAGTTFGVYGTSSSTDGRGVYGIAENSMGNNYGVVGKSISSSGTGVYGYSTASSGGTKGVYGRSYSSAGTGVYGLASASSGFTNGVYGISFSTSGRGVYGYASAASGTTFGVLGITNSTSGIGVRGESPYYGVVGLSYDGSGIRYGVYGNSNSTSGRGVYGLADALSGETYGVYGKSNSPVGRGVKGVSPYLGIYGIAEATTGVNYGVYGKSFSTSGYGVYGIAAATDGLIYGVYGKSNSPMGSGVYGEGVSQGSGVYGSAPVWGVRGYATNASGATYAVWGMTNSMTSGFAGYFNGRVHVSGTLSKGAGSFKIDHPLDPENKYLYHSFVESPDMKNIYDGVVILDSKGAATVELPKYFEALNKDFRYQLTCIGGFANVFISEEINNNSFKIAGGTAGMKVSWQVTGIRKDAFAEKYRIQVEEEKQGEERGKYAHPEAFGLSKSKGIESLHKPPERLVKGESELIESEIKESIHIEPLTPTEVEKHEPPTPPNFEPNLE